MFVWYSQIKTDYGEIKKGKLDVVQCKKHRGLKGP